MLIGTVRGGSGGGKGKAPIRDESLKILALIISSFGEELLINGMVDYVSILRSDMQKSNWSIVIIFRLFGKEIVWNIVYGTAFMA